MEKKTKNETRRPSTLNKGRAPGPPPPPRIRATKFERHEILILLNGNADLARTVPGMKNTSSTIFEQMKDHLYQIITALADLRLKNCRVKIIQFSGVESMISQYEPGGNGNSRLYGLDHYREEVKFKKPSQVSKKKLTRIEPLNHQSHLALCLQDMILDLVRMRESERVTTTQTTLLIMSDTQFALKGLKNGLASGSQWTIDTLAEVRGLLRKSYLYIQAISSL
jgi:hypothetical protein